MMCERGSIQPASNHLTDLSCHTQRKIRQFPNATDLYFQGKSPGCKPHNLKCRCLPLISPGKVGGGTFFASLARSFLHLLTYMKYNHNDNFCFNSDLSGIRPHIQLPVVKYQNQRDMHGSSPRISFHIFVSVGDWQPKQTMHILAS